MAIKKIVIYNDPIGCNERIGHASLRWEAERLANAVHVFKEDKITLEGLERQQAAWDAE